MYKIGEGISWVKETRVMDLFQSGITVLTFLWKLVKFDKGFYNN